jgi:cytochrome c-type biogenesis protein CcmH
MRILAIVALLCSVFASNALAVQPDEILKNPVLESRARALSRELRCMVCQNQSIDDSDATLARDLRILVRERLTAGDSDRQVIDFLVARYGEFVLLRPRFVWHTVLLWTVTPGLLLLGVIVLAIMARRRKLVAVNAAPLGLTPEEQARLAAIQRDSE